MVKYCDIYKCEECPKYGDDCDGDKRDDDLISRADAIEAVASITMSIHLSNVICDKLLALPSADAEPKRVLQGYNKGANTIQTIRHEELTQIANTRKAVESAEAVQGVGRYENAMQKLREMPRYLNGVKAKQINKIPSEAVQGEWRIGKPSKSGTYLITVDSMRHGMVDIFHYGKPLMPNRDVDGACWYRSDDEWGDVVYDDKDIFAWMPLPEPYKGGDDE